MEILVTGLVLFLAAHSVSIVSEPWRNRMVERFGESTWLAFYSLVSLVGFLLIVWGYGLARANPVLLYSPPLWLRHLTLLLMVPVFPLLFSAYLPGRIQTTVKHPMLLSIKLWALAHLLANGMLADLLLFGGFLAWAVVDRISLKGRVQRPVPGAARSRLNDAIALIAGLICYVIFVLWAHAWLMGVSPIGRTA